MKKKLNLRKVHKYLRLQETCHGKAQLVLDLLPKEMNSALTGNALRKNEEEMQEKIDVNDMLKRFLITCQHLINKSKDIFHCFFLEYVTQNAHKDTNVSWTILSKLSIVIANARNETEAKAFPSYSLVVIQSFLAFFCKCLEELLFFFICQMGKWYSTFVKTFLPRDRCLG